MVKRKRINSMVTTIAIMVSAVVFLVLIELYIIFSNHILPQTREALEGKALSIAHTVALTPLVYKGLEEGVSKDIQAYTGRISRRNDSLFVVVMDMNSIRYSHPNPGLIGQPFVGGGQGLAMKGEDSISVGWGTMGKSLRAFVPVYNDKGHQVGVVVVGFSMKRVHDIIKKNEWTIILILLSGALIGTLGAIVLGKRIKKMMFGMEPSEISRLLEERSAMLQSAREGIIAIDAKARITLINVEAERLLAAAGITGKALESYIDDYWPALRLDKVLNSGDVKLDEEIDLNGISLLANSLPIRVGGEIVGAIVTFRDMTEITQLAAQLSGISVYADALRAGAHEFMNKLHVILGMTHMGMYDELQQYISGTVSNYQSEIGSITRAIKDPVMAGFLLGKLSRAREDGINLVLEEDSYLPESAQVEVTHELITIAGNLLDNAMDALSDMTSEDNEIRLAFHYDEGRLICRVKDNGPGIPEALQKNIYTQGFSTKGENRGMGLYLVRRSVNKLNGHLQLLPGHGPGTVFVVNVPYLTKGDESR
ncbi:DcuS/MalK family sensor histidine kinase [Bacillus sp. FJAT-27264]|uniref:DcuS/MalK family sensor histidine kinase n=1 Tax=Paenibacillus sp. (strain DSM 101736 / FJAT-27264) TaxID=1850362 RepID=UPI000B194416|nr:DcuS/MalK family sensor histidine kinase [Bacillus sp. FJAT-27264]